MRRLSHLKIEFFQISFFVRMRVLVLGSNCSDSHFHIVEHPFVLESDRWECDRLLILVDHWMGMSDNENQVELLLNWWYYSGMLGHG